MHLTMPMVMSNAINVSSTAYGHVKRHQRVKYGAVTTCVIPEELLVSKRKRTLVSLPDVFALLLRIDNFVYTCIP